MKKKIIPIIMMIVLFSSGIYSEDVLAEQDTPQIDGSTEYNRESPYINSDIFKYFSMGKSELGAWNKIPRKMYADNGLETADYTLYSLDGQISQDGTYFEDSTVLIRICEMSEYSRRYPDIFEDITGYRGTFVDAISLRAGDVFKGVGEGDTLGTLKNYLRESVNQFDWNQYGHWTDWGLGEENIRTGRLEFTYNGYLFSIKIQEGYSVKEVGDAVPYNPDWRVFITNLNTGGDYTELAGVYVQVSETDNFGEGEPEFHIPKFGTILTIVPNSAGYIVKRYYNDEQGRWALDKFYDDKTELQLLYSEKRGGWTSYYGDNWYYLDIIPKGNKMELAGDGAGEVYKKIMRNVKSPIVE